MENKSIFKLATGGEFVYFFLSISTFMERGSTCSVAVILATIPAIFGRGKYNMEIVKGERYLPANWFRSETVSSQNLTEKFQQIIL